LHLPPIERRSRPFQRGATQRPAWNERIYLAAILRLRLRRAENGGVSSNFAFRSGAKCNQW